MTPRHWRIPRSGDNGSFVFINPNADVSPVPADVRSFVEAASKSGSDRYNIRGANEILNGFDQNDFASGANANGAWDISRLPRDERRNLVRKLLTDEAMAQRLSNVLRYVHTAALSNDSRLRKTILEEMLQPLCYDRLLPTGVQQSCAELILASGDSRLAAAQFFLRHNAIAVRADAAFRSRSLSQISHDELLKLTSLVLTLGVLDPARAAWLREITPRLGEDVVNTLMRQSTNVEVRSADRLAGIIRTLVTLADAPIPSREQWSIIEETIRANGSALGGITDYRPVIKALEPIGKAAPTSLRCLLHDRVVDLVGQQDEGQVLVAAANSLGTLGFDPGCANAAFLFDGLLASLEQTADRRARLEILRSLAYAARSMDSGVVDQALRRLVMDKPSVWRGERLQEVGQAAAALGPVVSRELRQTIAKRILDEVPAEEFVRLGDVLTFLTEALPYLSLEDAKRAYNTFLFLVDSDSARQGNSSDGSLVNVGASLAAGLPSQMVVEALAEALTRIDNSRNGQTREVCQRIISTLRSRVDSSHGPALSRMLRQRIEVVPPMSLSDTLGVIQSAGTLLPAGAELSGIKKGLRAVFDLSYDGAPELHQLTDCLEKLNVELSRPAVEPHVDALLGPIENKGWLDPSGSDLWNAQLALDLAALSGDQNWSDEVLSRAKRLSHFAFDSCSWLSESKMVRSIEDMRMLMSWPTCTHPNRQAVARRLWALGDQSAIDARIEGTADGPWFDLWRLGLADPVGN